MHCFIKTRGFYTDCKSILVVTTPTLYPVYHLNPSTGYYSFSRFITHLYYLHHFMYYAHS